MELKIISTLGPASLDPPFLTACANAGHVHFRLNGSHMDVEAIDKAVHQVRNTVGADPTRFTLDLQGSKRRIGHLDRPLAVQAGDTVSFELAPNERSTSIPVDHAELFGHARVGDRLVLQDGQVRATVTTVRESQLSAVVEQGHEVRSGCGLHVEGRRLTTDVWPEAQRQQIAAAARLGIQALALSYVQRPSEVAALRHLCTTLHYEPVIVAKVEHPEALEHLEAICEASDHIWFCRGDLGAIGPLSRLGAWQEQTITVSRRQGCPVWIAGQVFHHMTEHAQPTRSEVVHLHWIQSQGIAGIVLSDETAIGTNPVRTLRTVVELIHGAA